MSKGEKIMSNEERTKGVMTFHILIKFDDDEKIWLAHCLELDIVATARKFEDAKADIMSLMEAQIGYAFSHDNVDNLYHSAPRSAWKEFYECMEGPEERIPIQKYVMENEEVSEFVPPDVIAKTCIPA
ncbi:hypothetical protein MNBD_NITROSPINAE03-236 [hydrothermal vent metagenome]|uniref:DUF1902 domain-containing protein n=1 Tax=hydrothermal vent metagenome TaxID=652676 RepID=A0A3B1BIA5_9ZZZZ